MARGIKPTKDRSIVRSENVKIRFSPKEMELINASMQQRQNNAPISTFLRELILNTLNNTEQPKKG